MHVVCARTWLCKLLCVKRRWGARLAEYMYLPAFARSFQSWLIITALATSVVLSRPSFQKLTNVATPYRKFTSASLFFVVQTYVA